MRWMTWRAISASLYRGNEGPVGSQRVTDKRGGREHPCGVRREDQYGHPHRHQKLREDEVNRAGVTRSQESFRGGAASQAAEARAQQILLATSYRMPFYSINEGSKCVSMCSPRHRLPFNSVNEDLNCLSMCLPRHRMPFNSINEDAECVSIMWRAISARLGSTRGSWRRRRGRRARRRRRRARRRQRRWRPGRSAAS